MNKVDRVNYNVSGSRILKKIALNLSRTHWIFSRLRCVLARMGGVKIGTGCFLGQDVVFDSIAPYLITIEDGAYITDGVLILTHFLESDNWHKESRDWFSFGRVFIGKNAFVGARSVICNSVIIGEGAIVAAGSIVTKDIPSYEIWGGNPARFIKKRSR